MNTNTHQLPVGCAEDGFQDPLTGGYADCESVDLSSLASSLDWNLLATFRCPL